jgi:poly-D-alanine transfer protein DltD
LQIKKKGNGKPEPEHPSTIIVRSRKGERQYWTGKSWADSLTHAKKYLRADAEKKLKGKGDAFVITIGFR